MEKMYTKQERLTYLHDLVCDLKSEILKRDPALSLQEITFVKEMLGIELMFLFADNPLENSISNC